MRYLIITLLSLTFLTTSFAQRDTDDYFDEGTMLRDKLWFGTGGTLGFSGNDFRSIFQIGLSPMVGYKVIDRVSVGPRVGVTYVSQRFRITNTAVQRVNSFNFNYGVFARVKIVPAVFAHAEYSIDNFEVAFLNGSNGQIETGREVINHAYVGAGYQSAMGGVWGYEIVLLFDTLPQDDNFFLPPYVFRAGINYNF